MSRIALSIDLGSLFERHTSDNSFHSSRGFFFEALRGSDHQSIEQLTGEGRADDNSGRGEVVAIIQSERFVIHRVQLLVKRIASIDGSQRD